MTRALRPISRTRCAREHRATHRRLDISILTRPEENLALIIGDGKLYKNAIQ